MSGKREKPLGLDMPLAEALERFIGVDPDELPDNVKLRQKKGPQKRSLGVDEKPTKGGD
ncbi:hypothetical protein [Sphingobium algorifonticola]|uniref:hypothetical protein n=1 Tax=Sphingobium algorifonticola TaxID=2008318 RepID=UPI0013E358F4|nr:hypothetical protein [Sphingobium algorifonticola]